MKVLITGGLGFIGSNLTMRCIDLGWDVEVVDRNISRMGSWRKGVYEKGVYEKAAVHHCDFADDVILSAVRSGKYEVIFHQAALPQVSYSVEHPAKTTDENLLKTVQLLEAATGHCRRFVFASSAAVYGDNDELPLREDFITRPQSPYALQKRTCEDFIRLFCELKGLDAVSLRYFNVFGPWQYGDSPYATAFSSWCYCIKKGMSLRSDGDGYQTRDLCYVDNVVDANIMAATSTRSFSGQAYNIACGDRISNRSILEALRTRYPRIKVDYVPARAGDIVHSQGDITEAKNNLGYSPGVRFWEGFERTLRWWNLD